MTLSPPALLRRKVGGGESREVAGGHTCVTTHVSGCGRLGNLGVRADRQGASSARLWFPGCPAHRSGGSRCPPALPLRWLHFPRTPPGWDTVLATGTGLVLASFCSDEQRPLFFSLNESPQRCISRLSVIIALRSMTCFYSLSFHQHTSPEGQEPGEMWVAPLNPSPPLQMPHSGPLAPAGAWQSLCPLYPHRTWSEDLGLAIVAKCHHSALRVAVSASGQRHCLPLEVIRTLIKKSCSHKYASSGIPGRPQQTPMPSGKPAWRVTKGLTHQLVL